MSPSVTDSAPIALATRSDGVALAIPTGSELPVVHAVTNDEIVTRAGFRERACDVMRAMGARGALQLRAPRLAHRSAGALLELAFALAEEQQRTGAWLVVTDRIDVGMIAGARGIQLTGQSMEAADAARVIARAGECAPPPHVTWTPAFGASVHSLEEAIAARLAGATWGVVRKSDQTSGAALVRQLVKYGGLPIIAIGGIVPQHIAPLSQLGVRGVAAIRGIWYAENAGRAALDYLSGYDSEVGRG